MKNVELLAPAGSYETFKAVLNAGADAVYLAGLFYGARAYAGNLTGDELLAAIDYAHIHGKRLYLTVNTLLYDEEIKGLYDYLAPLYTAGLDGVIVQDLGAVKYINDNFPRMEIHASTQMTISDARYVNELKKITPYLTRIVPARELSFKEISDLKDKTGLEIETFVHGALCYCYSGQCLMSSFLGGRSGNRGKCAQPCRLEYTADGKTSNLLSLKDLCTLDILPEIIEAGADSLKIEGRMKSSEYAAGVTSIYRKYLDIIKNGGDYKVSAEDKKRLLMLFDRGGITDGYYVRHNGREMIADPSKSEKSLAEKAEYEKSITEKYCRSTLRDAVSLKCVLKAGEPSRLTMRHISTGKSVCAHGNIVSKALNRAALKDDVIKQLDKLGNTDYYSVNIDIEMQNDLFLPVKELNELRRSACDELSKILLEPYRRKLCDKAMGAQDSALTWGDEQDSAPVWGDEQDTVHEKSDVQLSVHILSAAQGRAVLNYLTAYGAGRVLRIVCDSEMMSRKELLDIKAGCRALGMDFVLAMPRIVRDNGSEKEIAELLMTGPDKVLIRSLTDLGIIRELLTDVPIIADFNVYAYNNLSLTVLKELGINDIIYSVELNHRKLANLKAYTSAELMVYGRIPLMTSAGCIDKNIGKEHCKTNVGIEYFTDRMKAKVPYLTACRYCYNIIYNSVPLYIGDMKKEIKSIKTDCLGVNFTDESEEMIDKIMDLVLRNDAPDKTESFTRGNFKSGAD